jgi:hypothetical protein
VGQYRSGRIGDGFLKSPHIGFCDLRRSNRDEAVAEASVFCCALFGSRSRLMRLLSVGMIVDDGREALRLELPECPGRRLLGNSKFFRNPNQAHSGLLSQ